MPIDQLGIPFDLGLAALPFLPRGKGATILIMGGILGVALAFLLSLVSLRLGARRGYVPRVSQGGASAVLMTPIVVRAPTGGLDDERLGWARPLIRDAAHAGVREMTVLAVERSRIVVRLDTCRSCETQGVARTQCSAERRLFSRLGRMAGHRVQVAELLCRRQGQGACVFEIDRGTVR